MLIAVVVAMVIPTVITAYGQLTGDESDPTQYDPGTDERDELSDSCSSDGYADGRDNPFDTDRYNDCGDEEGGADAYYQGFIEGCMSVEGNTRDICESATDAG